MATVLFWEKPGCINNARQQQWLRAAGHEVIARNLLREPWGAARLRRFFDTLPVTAQAKVLTMLEQFAGVGYIATVVSRLIGLTIVRQERG